jgi:hypothetical protein
MKHLCIVSLILAASVVLVGCGSEQPTPDTLDHQPQADSLAVPSDDAEPVTEPAKPERVAETPPDPQFMLDRLRENVSSSEWSIARSPLIWSTFTADVGGAFTPDTASTVWQRWTAVPTAITLKANTKIQDEIVAAIKDAKPGERPVERTFDFNGFRFVVTASNGESPDMTFVRISFMDSRYAN